MWTYLNKNKTWSLGVTTIVALVLEASITSSSLVVPTAALNIVYGLLARGTVVGAASRLKKNSY
jgi:hypothetical protein